MLSRIISAFLLCLLGDVLGQLQKSDSCTCVPYYKCDDKEPDIDNKTSTLSIPDVVCEDYLEVCCKSPVSPCGLRNPNGIGFTTNKTIDSQAAFGEFPWMVGVLKEVVTASEIKVNTYVCGGALIHPGIVLTAAHCVKEKNSNETSNFIIRAGEWEVSSKSEPLAHQNRDVKSVKIHPEFNDLHLSNDIALLMLDEPVEVAENVYMICLPPTDTVFENGTCFATGWGKKSKLGKYSDTMKKIELQIVNRDTCLASLRKSPTIKQSFDLHKSFICAKNEVGGHTCDGDGGSPLVCSTPGDPLHYYQVGIASWGIDCGEAGVPSAYVNVVQYLDWINEYIPK